MYLSERARQVTPPARGWSVPRTVLLLGCTSLFTDVSSEMVAAVLPIYLTVLVGLNPLQFGLIDGLYQGVTALVRLAGGFAADRWRRYKEVAAAGYALSALCKLGLLAAGGAVGALAAVIGLDRAGKGIRTPPRDALISLSSAPGRLGHAFGVHRALDTAGALAGPLLSFAILATVAGAFDAVFVVSFFAALVGLAILVLFVRNPARVAQPGPRPSLVGAVGGLVRAPAARSVVVAAGVLGLATVSDGFVYLSLQRRLDLPVSWFPLLFVGTAAVYLLLAVPAGRLADRAGRRRVLLAGHLVLAGVYVALLAPLGGLPLVAVVLALHGAYYAATDGVLAALASTALPAALRSSGLALVTTATALSRLVASAAFGATWTWWGAERALLAFLATLVAAVATAAVVLPRRQGEVAGAA